jgi:hypothetical protein
MVQVWTDEEIIDGELRFAIVYYKRVTLEVLCLR